jgi:hypothetical protein
MKLILLNSRYRQTPTLTIRKAHACKQHEHSLITLWYILKLAIFECTSKSKCFIQIRFYPLSTHSKLVKIRDAKIRNLLSNLYVNERKKLPTTHQILLQDMSLKTGAKICVSY